MAARTVIIGTLKLAQASAISTPSPTPSSMPITNAIDYRPGKIASLLDLSAAEIFFDFTAPFAVPRQGGLVSYRYVFLIGCNASAAATVECWAADTIAHAAAGGGSAPLHVGPQAFHLTLDNDWDVFPRRHTWLDLGSQRTEPVLRIKINDSGNPDGHLDVGVAFAHPGYVPSLPVAAAPIFGSVESAPSGASGTGLLTVGGTLHTQVRPVFATRELQLQAIGPTAAAEAEEQWSNLQARIGTHDPLVVVTDDAPAKNYMHEIKYGTLTSLENIAIPYTYGRGIVSLKYQDLR